MDVLADGAWERIFKVKPEVFTREEKRAWLDGMQDVALGSDAFFPFGDNIERAHKSGVKYVAQPGGSIRDDNVIETCNKYGIHRHPFFPSLIEFDFKSRAEIIGMVLARDFVFLIRHYKKKNQEKGIMG